MNDATVRQAVRAKIVDGRLPSDRVGAVSAANGTGQICDACSVPISLDEVLYKLVHERSDRLVFHATCFAIWRAERNSLTAVQTALD
jgi:hypothetical protein